MEANLAAVRAELDQAPGQRFRPGKKQGRFLQHPLGWLAMRGAVQVDARVGAVKTDDDGQWTNLQQRQEMHANVADASTQHRLITKLKSQFHVAHLHFNNFGCMPKYHPMPSYAWEVLFVNKRLASPSADTTPITRPDALDAPNNPNLPDCQYAPGS